MRDQLICFILMHSNTDWQRMIGSSETSEFIDWLWKEVDSYNNVNVETWIELKVNEYKS